jgi:hypothetical protein
MHSKTMVALGMLPAFDAALDFLNPDRSILMIPGDERAGQGPRKSQRRDHRGSRIIRSAAAGLFNTVLPRMASQRTCRLVQPLQ